MIFFACVTFDFTTLLIIFGVVLAFAMAPTYLAAEVLSWAFRVPVLRALGVETLALLVGSGLSWLVAEYWPFFRGGMDYVAFWTLLGAASSAILTAIFWFFSLSRNDRTERERQNSCLLQIADGAAIKNTEAI